MGGAERFMATREKEEDHEPKTRGGREPPKPVLSIYRREVKILVTPTGTGTGIVAQWVVSPRFPQFCQK